MIKTSVLLNRVLGKSDAFLQWGDMMALYCVHAVFVLVLFSSSCIKALKEF